MAEGSFNLAAEDGSSLSGRAWVPPGEVRAVLALVHGLGEHGGRYEKFAARTGEACTWKVWDGYRHELPNEPDNGEFFVFLTRWLEERSASADDLARPGKP